MDHLSDEDVRLETCCLYDDRGRLSHAGEWPGQREGERQEGRYLGLPLQSMSRVRVVMIQLRIKSRGLGLRLGLFMVSRLIELDVLLISKSVREPTRAVKRA